jgi:hypothetical protein
MCERRQREQRAGEHGGWERDRFHGRLMGLD